MEPGFDFVQYCEGVLTLYCSRGDFIPTPIKCGFQFIVLSLLRPSIVKEAVAKLPVELFPLRLGQLANLFENGSSLSAHRVNVSIFIGVLKG